MYNIFIYDNVAPLLLRTIKLVVLVPYNVMLLPTPEKVIVVFDPKLKLAPDVKATVAVLELLL